MGSNSLGSLGSATLSRVGTAVRNAKSFAQSWRNERAGRRAAMQRELELFQARHGYPLNLRNPKTFSEKLCWRKLYDRNPLLPVVVDKMAVRGLVQRLLGEREAARVLVPLLYSCTDPASLPFDQLPDEYVIKASHGSGYNLIVRGDRRLASPQVIERCRDWLSQPYGRELNEWAYWNLDRHVMVEELLAGLDGKPPREFKFHMFHGQCALVQALNSHSWYDGVTHIDSQLPTVTYFTPEWIWLDVSWHFFYLDEQFPTEPTLPRPAALQEMLALAEELSRPFDYIRVDLYDTRDGVKCGELTPYHLGGHGKVTPREFDLALGQRWRQKTSRWGTWPSRRWSWTPSVTARPSAGG